jgi:cysteine synthase
MKLSSILDGVGNTPHLKINRLFPSEYEVWIKLERSNPGGSIKDRIALEMILDAERRGILKRGSVIIEPTSGNTGIGIAMVGAVKGYRVILVMPESMSIERRKILRAYGAELVLTPKETGMPGAIEKSEQLARETENSWMPMQFENPANISAHKQFTSHEILQDFPEGIDALITGVGTGGHITGCAEVLREKWPSLKVFAVEPAQSRVIQGGTHTPHKIQGIGAGFIPKNLDTSLLDGSIGISDEEAFLFARRAAQEEGVLIGTSSGATLAAINTTLPSLPKGSRVLGFCYDTGERYLSMTE